MSYARVETPGSRTVRYSDAARRSEQRACPLLPAATTLAGYACERLCRLAEGPCGPGSEVDELGDAFEGEDLVRLHNARWRACDGRQRRGDHRRRTERQLLASRDPDLRQQHG